MVSTTSATGMPQRSEIENLLNCWIQSKDITLFCGNGCAGAHDEVVKLAEAKSTGSTCVTW